MGIEEYHFLTKTMKKIESLSWEISEKSTSLQTIQANLRDMEETLSTWKSQQELNADLGARIDIAQSSEENTKLLEKRNRLRKLSEKQSFWEKDWDEDAFVMLLVGWGFLFAVILIISGLAYLNNLLYLKDLLDWLGISFSEDDAIVISFWSSCAMLLGYFMATFRFTDPSNRISKIDTQLAQYDKDRTQSHRTRRKMTKLMKKLLGEKTQDSTFVLKAERIIRELSEEVEASEGELKILNDDLSKLWDSISHLIPFSENLKKT